MGKITGFLEIDRHDPKYAPVAERVKSYLEFVVPLSEKDTRDVATLTESLFSEKAHRLFLREVAKASQCALQTFSAWGESLPPQALRPNS